MKRGKKMLTIIISILGTICLIAWGGITFFGRTQTVPVKTIENLNGDLYLIRLTKPNNMTWKAGSSAQFGLHDVQKIKQGTTDTVSGATMNVDKNEENSRWLTIASSPDENEILILTHNSGSLYKKSLTSLPAGSKVEMSWVDSHFSVSDGKEPIICFASDVGIAAIRPIIKEWAGKRDIIFSHLDKGVTVFNEEITSLSNKITNLTYETSTSSSQSQETFKKAVDKYGNKAIYLLAGRPDDVEMMKNFLEENGISMKQIKVDSFKGLK
ncbi:ferredoxin reductase [Streptococcus ruminantium]|uniref:ferredoxin reductase n=1 Tax=Streptococcus ruminantium TaxID=1917441 RepID=UPI0012DF35BB|nr:ferredoxin reductase [Streptococcus ruminantium]